MAKAREEFNVPTQTVVGYRRYNILYRPKRKTDLYGETDTVNAEIAIFKHKDSASIANTFFHENLHAIYKESRLQDRVGEEHEEDIIRTLADNICQWFVNNPQQTKWMLEQLGVINAVVASPVGKEQGVPFDGTGSNHCARHAVFQDQEIGSK